MSGRYEFPDDIPVAIPVRLNRPPSLQEQVRNLVRGEMSRLAAEEGNETFEEADDFDVGDDYDPESPYELDFDQETYDGNSGRDETETGASPEGGGKTEGKIRGGGKEPDPVPKGPVEGAE